MTITSDPTSTSLTVPHPELTVLPAGTVPDAAYLRTIKRELYANAASVSTSLGGGANGHLGLLMSAADYNDIAAGTPFAIPDRPDRPNLADATGPQIAARRTAYEADMVRYNTCQAVIAILRQQLLAAVPHEYFAQFNDDLLGFSQASAYDMLTHLDTTYGTITADDLEANFARLGDPWDPTTPIESIFTNVTKCQAFATAGGDPISNAQAMREILKVIEATGVLDQAVAEWRLKPAAERTYANLLPFFRPRNQERLRIQALKGNKYSANKASSDDPSKKLMDMLAYCWTHGASTNLEHTSATCSNPATGHDKTATITDMKGGNNTIRRKPGEKAIYVKPNRKSRITDKDKANTAVAAPAPAPAPAPALRPSTYAAAADGMAGN